MAAFYYYDFDCGYRAKVRGSSVARTSGSLDRYVSIYIKPEANKLHVEYCSKCKK